MVCVLAIAAWFGTLEHRELFHPDEGRYAEIPREMVESGEWVIPHLNGLPYLEKPPLQYWATAAIYRLLGQDEWTARLWPALAGLGCVAWVGFAGWRLFGPRTAFFGAMIAASTLQIVVFSQVLTLDMGLTFFVSAAVFSLLLAQRSTIGVNGGRAWMLCAWAAMGLAVLSKGLIGVILPALGLALYAAAQRDTSIWRRLHLAPGLALLLALTVPWHLAVQARVPEFLDFYFLHEHVARFTQTQHGRPGPWYAFLVMFAIGALPWTPLYLLAWWRGLMRSPAADGPIDVPRLLALYALAVLAFFSLSQSKLPGYIAPAFPALALLAGRELAHRGARAARLAAVTLAACAALLPWIPQALRAVPRFAALGDAWQAYGVWVLAAALLVLAGVGLARSRLHPRRPLAAFASMATAALLAELVLINGTQLFAEGYSTENLMLSAEARGLALDADAPFFSVQVYDQTLPLHLGRTVTLVDFRDEFDFGLRLVQGRPLTIDEFRNQWRATPRAFAIMPVARYAAEREQGLPMITLARDARYVIVARQPSPVAERAPRSGVWGECASRRFQWAHSRWWSIVGGRNAAPGISCWWRSHSSCGLPTSMRGT